MPNDLLGVKFQTLHPLFHDHGIIPAPSMAQNWLSQVGVQILGCFSVIYLLDPTEDKPTWRMWNVPGQQPRFAWGHSTCVAGGTRALVLRGHTGEEWILNESHELSLASEHGLA